MKSRKQKSIEYEKLFGKLPNTNIELVKYLCDKYNYDFNELDDIKFDMEFKNIIKIVLFEIPEGAKRPRTRLINRNNITNLAIQNPNFIHIYSPNAKEDSLHMKKLVNDEIVNVKDLIMTPCKVTIEAYFKTPSSFNRIETILSEMKCIRYINTPDFDNIGKKYCDMFNSNIWLDDKLCISGKVEKFYSIKPRVEILLEYSDKYYTKKQAKLISNSTNINLDKLSYYI